jgi:hypothetical protein
VKWVKWPDHEGRLHVRRQLQDAYVARVRLSYTRGVADPTNDSAVLPPAGLRRPPRSEHGPCSLRQHVLSWAPVKDVTPAVPADDKRANLLAAEWAPLPGSERLRGAGRAGAAPREDQEARHSHSTGPCPPSGGSRCGAAAPARRASDPGGGRSSDQRPMSAAGLLSVGAARSSAPTDFLRRRPRHVVRSYALDLQRNEVGRRHNARSPGQCSNSNLTYLNATRLGLRESMRKFEESRTSCTVVAQTPDDHP